MIMAYSRRGRSSFRRRSSGGRRGFRRSSSRRRGRRVRGYSVSRGGIRL